MRNSPQKSLKNRKFILHAKLVNDFKEILDFDTNIHKYEIKPETITYFIDERIQFFRPTYLIHYRTDIGPAKEFPPTLCEIIPREDLRKNWSELIAQYKACIQFCKENGYRFKIITEKEIYNDYYHNAFILNKYNDKKVDVEFSNFELLLNLIDKVNHTTIDKLVLMGSNEKTKKAELLYTIWYLISNNYILCNLSKPISGKSEIWVNFDSSDDKFIKRKCMVRLTAEMNMYIKSAINTIYLTNIRLPIKSVCRQITKYYKNLNLEAPHINTIRNQILSNYEEERLRFRIGR